MIDAGLASVYIEVAYRASREIYRDKYSPSCLIIASIKQKILCIHVK